MRRWNPVVLCRVKCFEIHEGCGGAGRYPGYNGIFHKISHWHLNRYVNEFCGRHNIRGLDTVEMMLSMVAGMVGKRLTYMELIGM